MKEFLLNSNAKQKVFEALYTFQEPIHLRRIASLTGLLPRSVQLALQSFSTAKLLTNKKSGNRILYSLNKNHKSYEIFSKICEIKKKNEIQNRSLSYPDLSRSIKFIEEGHSLVKSFEFVT